MTVVHCVNERTEDESVLEKFVLQRDLKYSVDENAVNTLHLEQKDSAGVRRMMGWSTPANIVAAAYFACILAPY